MIYIGQVSKADPAAGAVRVTFADRDGLVTSELPVIRPGGWGHEIAIPEPGEMVLCVFLDVSRTAGFCLGTYGDPPGTADQRGTWFEDGSHVYYDRTVKQLIIKAVGGAQITGNVSVTGNLNVSGGLTTGSRA
ncbi:phage baseplate assembly protein V [Cohnella nanjingensis]|uniref:Phage baseplate assembly protein V n=1 Tax=Cohnella nanjingensis TaxID=1387779 RepID=A0A7X0VFD7_9BACL|nr:phage baseplate assembly protein V [Cohnella nanjingensis]MBB6670509.1 phage baseplate assembly protein V [Cohnella nanjingensis]